MAGRQADNQPLELAFGNPVKFFADYSVVPALDKFGPLRFNKANKIALTVFLFLNLLVPIKKSDCLLLILEAKNVKVFVR